MKYSIDIEPDFPLFEFSCTLVPKIEMSSFSSDIRDLLFDFFLVYLLFLDFFDFFDKSSADLTDKLSFNICFHSFNIA